MRVLVFVLVLVLAHRADADVTGGVFGAVGYETRDGIAGGGGLELGIRRDRVSVVVGVRVLAIHGTTGNTALVEVPLVVGYAVTPVVRVDVGLGLGFGPSTGGGDFIHFPDTSFLVAAGAGYAFTPHLEARIFSMTEIGGSANFVGILAGPALVF